MSHHHSDDWRSFLRSRTGIALLSFLALVIGLAVYEHRAHIFGSQIGLLALLLLCPLMHLFMHGGHRSHGTHENQSARDGAEGRRDQ
ncbi:MAG: DUF2933 domain-containing protein [Rhodospirillales bacterium]|nr:DUF2933 domain-containing protein [Rhodospirillales bacterium]